MLTRSTVIAVLLALSHLAQAQPRYPMPRFDTGKLPDDVAVGDLDHDGKIDVVAMNSASDDVTVFLGDGMGGLAFLQHVAVGAFPRALAIGEFNGDLHLDCIVANQAHGTVSLLVGDGTGALVQQSATSIGLAPNHLAVSDVDLDGDLDAFAGNSTGIVLLLSNGSGGFSVSAVGGAAPAFTAGDVTGDGIPDLVTAPVSPLRLRVFKGDGAGGFPLHSTTNVDGSIATSAALADLDADGDSDAALTVAGGNVTVMKNLGTGSFTQQIQLIEENQTRVVIADENGDGNLDLVAMGFSAVMFPGSGAGTFGPKETRPALGVGRLADMNGDGRQDYVTGRVSANYGYGSVLVAMRDSLGRWQGGYKSPVVADANALLDIDLDSDIDYVDTSITGDSIVTGVNDGLANFADGPTSPIQGIGYAFAPIAGDFDGDGIDDLLFTTSEGAFVKVHGTGAGTFVHIVTSGLPSAPPGSVYLSYEAADLDQDGALDVAIERSEDNPEKSSVVALRNAGNGSLTHQATIPFGLFLSYAERPFSLADLDGDGAIDVMAGDAPTVPNAVGRFSVALSSGTFQWSPPVSTPLGGVTPHRVLAADFDSDGIVDVAALYGSSFSQNADALVTVLHGSGGGALVPGTTIDTGSFNLLQMELAIADFDADGREDLTVSHGNIYALTLIDNLGAGSFAIGERYFAQGMVFRYAVRDLDADGRLDLMGSFGSPLIAQAPVTPCPGGFDEYGAGCHGHSFFVPHLAGFGCPTPGSDFVISIESAPAATIGLLFVGTGPASLPIGYGCSFLVSPTGMQLVAVPIGGSGVGGGKLSLYGTLPLGFPTGFAVHCQLFVPTSDVLWGFASSNGLKIDIQ